MAARSFNIPITSIDGLVRPLAAIRSDVPAPSGGLVFVSGAPSQELGPIADQVRTAWKGVATCIVPAAGVLTERAEMDLHWRRAGLGADEQARALGPECPQQRRHGLNSCLEEQ